MAGHATRPMQPPHEVTSHKEVSIFPATVVGAQTGDNRGSTYPSYQLVSPLVHVVLLQVIREEHLAQFAVDPVLAAEALQRHQYPPGIRHQLARGDLIMIADVPNQP